MLLPMLLFLSHSKTERNIEADQNEEHRKQNGTTKQIGENTSSPIIQKRGIKTPEKQKNKAFGACCGVRLHNYPTLYPKMYPFLWGTT